MKFIVHLDGVYDGKLVVVRSVASVLGDSSLSFPFCCLGMNQSCSF